MRDNKIYAGLCVVLTVFMASSFVAVVPAVAQTETVLFSFYPTDGSDPLGGLIFDSAGNLYGTTVLGGAYGYGTAFELSPAAGGGWTETVLHSFDNNGTDGYFPNSGLAFDAAGNLYGTTSNEDLGYCESVTNCGILFELSPVVGGEWAETIVSRFDGNAAGGYGPVGGVVVDAAGNLYGVTELGGSNLDCYFYTYCGMVYEFSPAAGGGWTEKILHAFSGKNEDGENPQAGLVFDTRGDLYGTTLFGGTGYGTVFELRPGVNGKWTETMLHRFSSNGKDGNGPSTALTFNASGNLYGITEAGGIFGGGTAFELTPTANGGWAESVLHNFRSNSLYGQPSGSLIADASGNLYGVTSSGGTNLKGAIYELSSNGSGSWRDQILYSFGKGIDGIAPVGSLIFDSAGNLYGATGLGGLGHTGYGTVFEVTR
jgi:uncharacterized repeat protein (TIGR03803 family)